MKVYDYIIITNLPAFYKTNLYNKLNEKCNIFVIYVSNSSKIREKDFFGGDINYEHIFLFNDLDYECRNKFSSLLKLIFILNKMKFKRIIFPGWELMEFIPLAFFFKKYKLGLVIESSIIESKTEGILWHLKKMYINKFGVSFPSGILQAKILEKANYKNKISYTYGVGIPNRVFPRKFKYDCKEKKALNCLYVGRISKEKNLDFLIDKFKNLKHNLTIIGTGNEITCLRNKSSNNILFKGYIENEKLANEYLEHDLFILPSISEPWGLVIDEALWFGLPVLVSSNVGCAQDLVADLNTGRIFDLNNAESFEECLEDIFSNYTSYKKNVCKIQFLERDKKQVSSYFL